MTLAFIAAVYVLGGLTFIPFLLAGVLIPAWYLLPQTDDKHRKTSRNESDAGQTSEAPSSPDGAASGTFAVLRTHNFPAASTALNSRNNHGQAGLESDGEVSAPSESVYQSMYRSVFDRGKSAAASSTVLERDDAPSSSNTKTSKNTIPVNVFHIVLRHGHLMLYDSAAQVEVRHVISMANHTISLSEGGAEEEEDLKDADLFIKRTAIVLTPIEYPNGQLQPQTSAAKPFYLFSTTCSEKEDFYHALLYTRAKPPLPMPLDPNDAIKLQSALHSTSLTAETKALNAFIGRIFLALYRTDRVKDLIICKVEKKISRVSKPAFIASLAVHSIDLGDASPMMSNLKLKDFNINGDMTMSFDLRYDGGVRSSDGLQKRTGGIKLTISALAKLDLGPRFKTRTVDLLLATSLQRLSGRMLVRVKPPPSNRIWFCFESMPEMDIRVEPIVSQRQITYSFVLRAIEERIRAVVGETLVKPNWDDAAFFDTRGQTVRGGIWQDEGSNIRLDDGETEQPKPLSKHAKTMSMPHLVGEADSSGASSGSETTSKMASGSSLTAQYLTDDLKRRSAASLPMRSETNLAGVDSSSTSQRMRPLRSPSFAKAATSAASVAVDDVTAEQVRVRDLAAPPPRMWRMRTPQLKKEAMDAMREVRDRAYRSDGVATPQSPGDGQPQPDAERTSLEAPDNGEDVSTRRSSDPSSPSGRPTGALASGTLLTPKRTNTKSSTTSNSSASSASQQQRKTILAATAAATSAARNWSWNAINNARTAKAGAVSHNRRASDEPMGRGQPLPPPGMPLPGPQKVGIFSGLGGGSMKRKPVPPPRSNASDEESGRDQRNDPQDPSNLNLPSAEHLQEIAQSPASDAEFGPWSENSGMALGAHDATQTSIEGIQVEPSDDPGLGVSKLAPALPSRLQNGGKSKAPPPLPTRRPKPTFANVKEDDSSIKEETLTAHSANVADIPSQPAVKSNGSEGEASAATAAPQQLLDEPELLSDATAVESGVGEEQASKEELELPDDDEEDAVIAIPAPVVEEEDAEEVEPKKSESVFEASEADKDAHPKFAEDKV